MGLRVSDRARVSGSRGAHAGSVLLRGPAEEAGARASGEASQGAGRWARRDEERRATLTAEGVGAAVRAAGPKRVRREAGRTGPGAGLGAAHSCGVSWARGAAGPRTGKGRAGLLGWAAVGFGVCWIFFFSILFLFKLTQLNSIRIQIQNLNSTTLCTQANKINAPA